MLTVNKKITALIFTFSVGWTVVGYALGYAIYQPQILTLTDRYNNLNTEYVELSDEYGRLYAKRIYCTVIYRNNMLVPNATWEEGASFVFPLNFNYNISDIAMSYNVTENRVVKYLYTNWDVWNEGKPIGSLGGILESKSGTVGLAFSNLSDMATRNVTNCIIFFYTSWTEEVRLDFQIDVVLTQYKSY